MSAEKLDPLTGLPLDFIRMLAVRVDPYDDRNDIEGGAA
jgi:hypothetical protein